MRAIAKRTAGGLALVGGVVLFRRGTRGNRALRHQIDVSARRLRHLGGRLQGLSHRLRGGRPDPSVSDLVLADRVRSSLGSLQKRLDVPHVHVMVEDHVALLHGAVAFTAEADEIERAVAAVSGIVGVESYLHVGLIRGDTRPSAGRKVHHPSDAQQRLIAAATEAGVDPSVALAVVRAVLATFADRIPRDEREQVAAHLPADVRELFTPQRRTRQPAPPRTVAELVARIAATAEELPRDKAEEVTTTVLRALRSLVPEEAGDIAAVLPSELRTLWQGAQVG